MHVQTLRIKITANEEHVVGRKNKPTLISVYDLIEVDSISAMKHTFGILASKSIMFAENT